jgi:hypothetical protein
MTACALLNAKGFMKAWRPLTTTDHEISITIMSMTILSTNFAFKLLVLQYYIIIHNSITVVTLF